MFFYCGGDFRTFYCWFAHLDSRAIGDQQNWKRYFITDFVRQFLHVENVTFLGAVLPPATLYDCIHIVLQSFW